MKKLTIPILLVVIVLLLAFGKSKTKYEVVQLESQHDVTLWLNTNQPEVIEIETTGTLWWVFYTK